MRRSSQVHRLTKTGERLTTRPPTPARSSPRSPDRPVQRAPRRPACPPRLMRSRSIACSSRALSHGHSRSLAVAHVQHGVRLTGVTREAAGHSLSRRALTRRKPGVRVPQRPQNIGRSTAASVLQARPGAARSPWPTRRCRFERRCSALFAALPKATNGVRVARFGLRTCVYFWLDERIRLLGVRRSRCRERGDAGGESRSATRSAS
jgi:hypothetical protein